MTRQREDANMHADRLVSKLDTLNTNIRSLTEQLSCTSDQLDTSVSTLTRGIERVADRIETILTPEITSAVEQSKKSFGELTHAVEGIEQVLKSMDNTITYKSFSSELERTDEAEFDLEAGIRKYGIRESRL